MKKIFTLIAMTLMALTINAQGTYALEAGQGAITAGTVIKSVDNITLTFGIAGEADFKDPKADTHVDGYTAFTEGNGVNGKEDSGTLYVFAPSKSGSITVAVVLNADKKFFVTEDGTALADYNGITESAKAYKTYNFDVKGGKTYKVYCTGSKLGFYGFEYTVSDDTPDTPSTPATGEAESYRAIAVDADGNITLAKEFADVVDESGVAKTVVDGKSVVTITTANMTLEAVGGATIANKIDPDDPKANIGQDLVPGAVIDEEAHTYQIASVGSWNDITWKNGNNKTDINDAAQTKLYFVMGTGNPYVNMYCEETYTDGNPTGKYRAAYDFYKPGMETMPLVGLYYKFSPKADGSLKVQVWANKGNRNTYVIDGETKEGVKYTAEGYINGQKANYETPAVDPETGEPKVDNQGNPVYEQYCIFFSAEEIQARHDAAKANEEGEDTAPFVIDNGGQAFWGWITFPVKAGKTYWLFQDSSQVGFGGFDFTPADAAGITETVATVKPVTGKIYNLRGQEVDSTYKGLVIKNGKKVFVR